MNLDEGGVTTLLGGYTQRPDLTDEKENDVASMCAFTQKLFGFLTKVACI